MITTLPTASDTIDLERLTVRAPALTLRQAPRLLAHLARDPAFLDACVSPLLEGARSAEANEVVGEGRMAFQEACEYPDGVRVLGAEMLEVRDGKIVRQVNVEAWDE